jgi:23S rRNA A2030 N6-methylase RlmJ
MSLYSHAGVSKLNGEFKVRFANDALRVKVLAKNGHKDIDIIELKTPMTKEDAVALLLSINFANGNKAIQAALEEAAGKRGIIFGNPPFEGAKNPGKSLSKQFVKLSKKMAKNSIIIEPKMTVQEAMNQVGDALM